jgi:hypothetical protein
VGREGRLSEGVAAHQNERRPKALVRRDGTNLDLAVGVESRRLQ